MSTNRAGPQTDLLEELHKLSFGNGNKVREDNSDSFGIYRCYHCLATFRPWSVLDFTVGDDTAKCPQCEIDSIISEEEIGEVVIKHMQAKYFAELLPTEERKDE